MCGLSAILSKQVREKSTEQLIRLHHSIKHRGPDGEGALSWSFGQRSPFHGQNVSQVVPGNVLFAHRRLSIIDLSKSADQPIISPDGQYSIIFNGEIYNYIELKRELEREGVSFQTTSDTEVLLHGYRVWGEDVVHKINGMFSFLILDLKGNRLFVARDPFGIKPLYYIQDPNHIYFSSDISALTDSSILQDRSLNKSSLYQYLQFGQTDQGSRTFFKNIQAFPQAHYAHICLATHKIDLVQYWKPKKNTLDISFDQAVTSIRELFLNSLDIHMRSDAKIGATLSGGIDSSAVVMGMRHLRGSTFDIPTFSYCASKADISEEKWIDLVNDKAAAIPYKTFVNDSELEYSLDNLIKLQGEPFGSTSIFAQFKVYQAIQNTNVKVVLDGQGADEVFAGYTFYLRTKVLSFLKKGKFIQAKDFLKRVAESPNLSWKNVAYQTAASFLPLELHDLFRNTVRKNHHSYWLKDKWFQDHSPSFNPYMFKNIKDCLAQSLTETVLPSLLRYQDRNSMFFSLESRVPFLEKNLVDFVFQLPEEFFIAHDATTKPLLREALKGILPDEIVHRKDKVSFQTPQSSWMNSDHQLAAMLSDRIKKNNYGFLDSKKTLAFLANTSTLPLNTWRLLNLFKWLEIFNVDFEN